MGRAPDRSYPADPDAERAVLLYLIRGEHHEKILQRVRENHFYDAYHRVIFRVLVEEYEKRNDPSLRRVLKALLRSRWQFRPIDLALLEGKVQRPLARPSYYVARLRDCSELRNKIINAERQLLNAWRSWDEWAWSQTRPPEPVVAEKRNKQEDKLFDRTVPRLPVLKYDDL